MDGGRLGGNSNSFSPVLNFLFRFDSRSSVSTVDGFSAVAVVAVVVVAAAAEGAGLVISTSAGSFIFNMNISTVKYRINIFILTRQIIISVRGIYSNIEYIRI